jgi:predicted DNA-binding transcriptional regulator AlpA
MVRWQHLRKDTPMDGRCISQNELAQRWQVSESTLERWRLMQTGPKFTKLQNRAVRYHLDDIKAYESQRA